MCTEIPEIRIREILALYPVPTAIERIVLILSVRLLVDILLSLTMPF